MRYVIIKIILMNWYDTPTVHVILLYVIIYTMACTLTAHAAQLYVIEYTMACTTQEKKYIYGLTEEV